MKTFLVGSKQLGLDNIHDTDYLVLLDGKQQDEHKPDFHVWFENDFKSFLRFEHEFNWETVRTYIILYQVDVDIIGNDFPIEYHLLDWRDNYIELLRYIVDNKACNFSKDPSLNRGKCSKLIYHIAYITFILQNNSTTLTAEQKEIVQKIHDRQMPQDYLDVLKEKIKQLEVNNADNT